MEKTWSGGSIQNVICRDFWKFETKVVHCPEGPVHCGTLLRDGRGKLPGRPGGRERQCTDPWDPWGTSSFTSVDQGGPAAATGAQGGRSEKLIQNLVLEEKMKLPQMVSMLFRVTQGIRTGSESIARGTHAPLVGSADIFTYCTAQEQQLRHDPL